MLTTKSTTPSVARPRQNLRNMTNTYPSPRGATTPVSTVAVARLVIRIYRTATLRTGARVRLGDLVPRDRLVREGH